MAFEIGWVRKGTVEGSLIVLFLVEFSYRKTLFFGSLNFLFLLYTLT